MKKLLCTGLIAVYLLNGMDEPELALVNHPEGQFARLPAELQLPIVIQSVQANDLATELKNYGKLLTINKRWHNFLSDAQTIKSFLQYWNKKYGIPHYILDYQEHFPDELKMSTIYSAITIDDLEKEITNYSRLATRDRDWRTFFSDPINVGRFLKYLGKKYNLSYYQIAFDHEDVLLFKNWLKKLTKKQWLKDANELLLRIDIDDIVQIKRLITTGTDPNVKDPANPNSPTPLFYAVSLGKYPVAQTLLNHGANPNIPITSIGWTPLIKAVKNNNFALVTLLLESGANPNIQTIDSGSTALMIAADTNNPEIVSLLLKHGANKQLKNKNQHTAADIAQRKKNKAVIQLLADRDKIIRHKSRHQKTKKRGHK